jgi:hypothetical protein
MVKTATTAKAVAEILRMRARAMIFDHTRNYGLVASDRRQGLHLLSPRCTQSMSPPV